MTKSNMIKHHRLNVVNNIRQIKICNWIDEHETSIVDIYRGIDQYKLDMDTSITTAILLTISKNTQFNQH